MPNVIIKGIPSAKRPIRNLQIKMQTTLPIYRKIGRYLSHHNKAVFASNGNSIGHNWRALNPEYRQWKIKHGYGAKGTLVRSGKLKASYTNRPMGIEIYKKTQAKFGTNIKYAKYLEYGTRYMPARPVMIVTKKMEHDITEIVSAHFAKKTPIKVNTVI